MNRIQRRRLKRSANLKLLFFTFFGAFILFFTAFTYLLPMLTPEVEIPALTEDHVFNSITSHDFRGRIDPRLHSIELQEEVGDKRKKEKKSPKSDKSEKNAFDNISRKAKTNKERNSGQANNIPLPGARKQSFFSNPEEHSRNERRVASNTPPRPGPIKKKETVNVAPPAPVFKAKVIVGDFSSIKEASMTSEILISLDFEPFITQQNGQYALQLGSFSNTEKANALVQELKNRNFNAKIIYE